MQMRPSSQAHSSALVRFTLIAAALTLAGLAGYAGYALYPRFDLPSSVGIGLLFLAAAAGVAAFFSPCSFALLLTLLSRTAEPRASRGFRLRRAFVFAGSMSLGAVVFVMGLGLLIALGGRALAGAVTFESTTGIALRVAVGTVLVVFGLAQIGIIKFRRSVHSGTKRL